MAIGDSVVHPIEELVEQAGPSMTCSYPFVDFNADKICGVLEFGKIIHIPDNTCPELTTFSNAQKAAKSCLVIEPLLGSD